jgi:site-specific recombinase XerD
LWVFVVQLNSTLLRHARIDKTQIYTKIRPPQLKRAVAFYEDGPSVC